MDTNLRASDNEIKAEGILSDFTLEKKKTDKGDDIIQGSVSLKISDINTIKFGVYVNALKNNGEQNTAYSGLETIMSEYKSIADVGIENADKISINRGQFNFYRMEGRELVNYRNSYFHRIREDEKFEPKCEFGIEVYISAITPEFDKEGDETGRLQVKGWTVTYNGGVEPITMIAPKDIANAIENAFEVGQTAKFFGDIVNERVEVVKEIPVAIGKPRTEITTSYKNEIVITGASTPYEEGVTERAPYAKESIDLAIQERNNRIAEEENKKLNQKNPFNGNNNTPSAAAKGRTISW